MRNVARNSSYSLLFRGQMFWEDLDTMLRFKITNETGIPE